MPIHLNQVNLEPFNSISLVKKGSLKLFVNKTLSKCCPNGSMFKRKKHKKISGSLTKLMIFYLIFNNCFKKIDEDEETDSAIQSNNDEDDDDRENAKLKKKKNSKKSANDKETEKLCN